MLLLESAKGSLNGDTEGFGKSGCAAPRPLSPHSFAFMEPWLTHRFNSVPLAKSVTLLPI
jgi:hypothetical protein